MAFRFVCIITFIVAFFSTAFCQSIRYEDSISGSETRGIFRAVEDSGLSDMPDLREAETGTIVSVSGDFFNSDVTLYCGKEFDQAKLKKIVASIAAVIDRPKTDFIIGTGRRLQYADMEFNEYISRDQWTSKAEIPLGKIVREIIASELPKPIVIVIKGSKSNSFQFSGRVIGKYEALAPSSISADATVTTTIRRTVGGLVTVIIFGILLTSLVLISPLWMVIKALKEPPLDQNTPETLLPNSLKEVQQAHEASKKKSWQTYVPLLAILPILVMQLLPISDALNWFNLAFNPRFAMVVPIPIIAGPLLAKWIQKRRGTAPKVDPAFEHQMKSMNRVLIPMLAGMLLMSTLVFFPGIMRSLPSQAVRPFIFSILGLSFAASFILFRIGAKKDQRTLGPGDMEYDAAMEIAKAANIKLTRVYVNGAMMGVNAAASMFRTVFFTPDFVTKMPVEEKKAIIAHEIGHIKGQHVPMFTLISLVSISFISALVWQIRDGAKDWPTWASALIRSPLAVWIPYFLIIAFGISNLRRRAEFSADRFALEYTKDYSLVATGLARIHLLNATPLELSKGEERIATHPSLAKRLDSLRVIAEEMGLPCDETEVNKIIYGELETDARNPGGTAPG